MTPPKPQHTPHIAEWIQVRQRDLVWLVACVSLIWVAWEVREVTTLLLFAYVVAVLLNPLVVRLTELRPLGFIPGWRRWQMSRGAAVGVIGLILTVLFSLLLFFGVPWALRQYTNLIANLPNYLEQVDAKLSLFLRDNWGISSEEAYLKLVANAKESLSALSIDELKRIFLTLMNTVLQGYSLTLTVVNLILLPFFLFYILRDLNVIHRFIGGLLSDHSRKKAINMGEKVLEVVQTFFRAQLVISLIGALLYGSALAAVGLPSGFFIGVLTGLLNVVPYLGVGIGIITATIVGYVSDPSWSHMLLIWGVFLGVNTLQDNFIAPWIIGEKLGLHPLGVMLALIVGGHLLGLLGLIIAIPAAASLRVLFHMLTVEEEAVA